MSAKAYVGVAPVINLRKRALSYLESWRRRGSLFLANFSD
jgi:hypothetical protein